MTCNVKNTQFELAMEVLINNGFNGVANAIAIMMNGAMQIERSRYLQAEPYERTEHRQSYANGYKPKTVKTRGSRMKDGTTHLAYKPEHGVDLDTGGMLAASVYPTDKGDTEVLGETLTTIQNNLSILSEKSSCSVWSLTKATTRLTCSSRFTRNMD